MTPDKIWSNLVKKLKPQHKTAFLSAFIIGLLTHLYAMTNNFLTYDSMWNIYSDQDMITSGRQFLTYACSVGSYFDLPMINGLLAIIWLSISAALIVECFNIEGKVLPVIAGGLMVTFPSVSSTFAYSYTIDGYMLAILLSILAFFLADRFKYGFIAGIFSLGISLGIYQAEFSFTILICICALFIYILNNTPVKEMISKIWRYIVMGVGGYAFYLISLKIMLSIKHTEISGYQGTDRVSTFALSDLPTGLKAAWENFYYFMRYGGIFSATGAMKISYLVFMAMGAVSFVYLFIKKKAYKSVFNIVLTIVLAMAIPFSSCLITILSPDTYFHILMRMPWVAVMIFFAALISMFNKEVSIKAETAMALVSVLSAFVLILQFAVSSNIVYFNLNERYEKTYALCVRMVDRIEQTEGYEAGMPVAILGGFPDDSYYAHTDITADVLSGYFGVDGEYVCNSTSSFESFMERYLNFSFPVLSLDEELALIDTDTFKGMKNFPNAESLEVINGVLVIKLNG